MKVKIFGAAPIKHGLMSLCVVASISCACAQSAINPKTALVAAFDQYSVAANHGSLSAASELFGKSRECLLVHRIDSRMAWLQSDKNSFVNAPEKDGPLLSSHLEKMGAARRRAELSRTFCQGSERKVTTNNIYDIALTAARLGDISASACFMASPWTVENADVDKAKGTQYKSAAEYLATHMIEKGDWHFVQAMVIASAPGMRYGYAAYIQNEDAAAQLRYTKLLRLGVASNSDDAKNLDLSISILSDRLRPETVGKADEWAHDMFNRYYVSQSRPTSLSACDA